MDLLQNTLPPVGVVDSQAGGKMELITSEFPLKGLVISRIGGRSENQDCYGFRDLPIGTVIVVCDGMGGMQGGSFASSIAVKSILNTLAQAPEGYDPQEAVKVAIRQANMDIIQTGSENPHLYGMGTTVTVLLLDEKCATVAYVGDSRVYQLRGRKKHFRTFDHSMVFEMVKQGVINEEQARCSANSNIILKALGVQPEVEPDVCQLPYLKGDRFLLCSDGFWGAMPEPEFIKMVTGRDFGTVIERTANEVEQIGHAKGGGHDNLTAAMVELKCNSIMKEKMSTKIKITIAALVLALVVSLSLNIVQLVKSRPSDAPVQTEAVEMSNETEESILEDLPNADSETAENVEEKQPGEE